MRVSQVAIQPLPGTSWDDTQKALKKCTELLTKHGAENVTVLAAVKVFGDPDKTLPPPVPANVAVNGPNDVIPVPVIVYG